MLVADLHYIIHWPTHGGYNFISGPLADITLVTAFVGTLYMFLRKNNCHVHGCWRLQWHHHPDHGHPVCKHHHPHGKSVGVAPPPRAETTPHAPQPKQPQPQQEPAGSSAAASTPAPEGYASSTPAAS
jgi:hypothetical protein